MSHDPHNPYQSPNFTDQPQTPMAGSSEGLSSSILTQQRVVSILMLVQGGLACVMGLFLIGMAVALPMMMTAEFNRQNPNGPPVEQFKWIMLAIYGSMGLCGLIPGILQIYAGIQNLNLRGHMLGIIAISSGAVSFVTCYCIPTALALMVYGLIIYLHPTTKSAFHLAQEGHNFDTIMQMALNNQYGAAGQKPPGSF